MVVPVNGIMTDPGFSARELGEVQRRVGFLKIGVVIVVGLLVLRLWQLQVRDGPHYQELSQHNRTRSIVLHPARGLIYDRNGLLLANSVPSFNVYVELSDVRNRERLLQKLEELLALDARELNQTMLTQGRTRVKLKAGLSLKEAAIVESHRLDLPGVVIHPEYQRNYPQGSSAAHVIGYVGEISEDQLGQEKFHGLVQGSIIGRYGVERVYDRALRGKAGRKLIEVDALGHEKRTIFVENPQAGNDVYLTLDFRLQRLAEDALGDEAGAIVALDPQTGETLALASRPGFDLNALSRGLSVEEWNGLLHDPRHPLTNRAIQGQYPPGSVFKIIMAGAVLGTGAMDPTERIRCGGGFRFGRRTFRDWKAGGHGHVDLHAAMMQSCDVYFYRLGHRLGIETIATHAKRFGLGRRTGVDLPAEATGIVPSPEWKQQTQGEVWYPGETISVSIGQGFVTVTPLQMANVMAAVGNNGTVYTPHVVRGVRQREHGVIQEWNPARGHAVQLVQPQGLHRIRTALAAVVAEGTGRRARSSVVGVAGKTGTAQVVALREESEDDTPKKFRDHAWFVAYAPLARPRIAVAVLVEHMGQGGVVAAPLAKALIEAYLSNSPDAESTTPASSSLHSRAWQEGEAGHG